MIYDIFNNICSSVLDKIASGRYKKPSHFLLVWINDEIRELENNCHKAEYVEIIEPSSSKCLKILDHFSLKTVNHVFITCCLDYCNSLLS